MNKMNQFFILIAFASLLTLPFLTGCAETEREMMFPNTDLPESATVIVEATAEAEFKLIISTDYRKEKNNFGGNVIIHNSEKEYAVTQDFSETIYFDSEEPRISVKLTCTNIDSIDDNSGNSVHLIVRFNGDGNFRRGNHNHNQPIELGSFINVKSAFNRYEGVSSGIDRGIDPKITNFSQ